MKSLRLKIEPCQIWFGSAKNKYQKADLLASCIPRWMEEKEKQAKLSFARKSPGYMFMNFPMWPSITYEGQSLHECPRISVQKASFTRALRVRKKKNREEAKFGIVKSVVQLHGARWFGMGWWLVEWKNMRMPKDEGDEVETGRKKRNKSILTLWRKVTIFTQVKRSLAHHDLMDDYCEAVDIPFLGTLRRRSLHSQQLRRSPELFWKRQYFQSCECTTSTQYTSCELRNLKHFIFH